MILNEINGKRYNVKIKDMISYSYNDFYIILYTYLSNNGLKTQRYSSDSGNIRRIDGFENSKREFRMLYGDSKYSISINVKRGSVAISGIDEDFTLSVDNTIEKLGKTIIDRIKNVESGLRVDGNKDDVSQLVSKAKVLGLNLNVTRDYSNIIIELTDLKAKNIRDMYGSILSSNYELYSANDPLSSRDVKLKHISYTKDRFESIKRFINFALRRFFNNGYGLAYAGRDANSIYRRENMLYIHIGKVNTMENERIANSALKRKNEYDKGRPLNKADARAFKKDYLNKNYNLEKNTKFAIKRTEKLLNELDVEFLEDTEGELISSLNRILLPKVFNETESYAVRSYLGKFEK